MGRGRRNSRNCGWQRGHGRFRNLIHGNGFTPGPAAHSVRNTGTETKSVVRAEVDPGKCAGCALCTSICRSDAIDMVDGIAVVNNNCIGCGMCVPECPEHAISLTESTITA